MQGRIILNKIFFVAGGEERKDFSNIATSDCDIRERNIILNKLFRKKLVIYRRICKKRSEQLSALKRSSLIFSVPSFCHGKQLLSGCAQHGPLCRPAVPLQPWPVTDEICHRRPHSGWSPRGNEPSSHEDKGGTFLVGGKTTGWMRP